MTNLCPGFHPVFVAVTIMATIQLKVPAAYQDFQCCSSFWSWLLITRSSDQVHLLLMDTVSGSIFVISISNLYHPAQYVYIIRYGRTPVSVFRVSFSSLMLSLLFLSSCMSSLQSSQRCVATSLRPCLCTPLSLRLSCFLFSHAQRGLSKLHSHHCCSEWNQLVFRRSLHETLMWICSELWVGLGGWIGPTDDAHKFECPQ